MSQVRGTHRRRRAGASAGGRAAAHLARGLVVGTTLGITCLWAVAQTPPAGAGRLPQDVGREPRAAPREGSISIGTDLTAAQAPPGAERQRLVLSGVELSGNDAIPTARLEPLWRPLLGQPTTLARVFDLAARITAVYRDAGYLLSQAIVPAQALQADAAVVRLRVVEGRLGELRLPPGTPGEARIRRTMAPALDPVPATLDALESAVLRVNDLPGTVAQATLAPGGRPGTSDVDLRLDRTPWTAWASVNNRTTEALGRVRAEAGGELRGVAGAFDRHALRWAGSGDDRLRLLAYAGAVPVGPPGLELQWGLSGSRARPLTGAPFNLDTDSRSASVGASYALHRSRDRNLTLRAGLNAYDGSVELVQTGVREEQRLRIARVGATVDAGDRFGGVTVADVELSRGLAAFGASSPDDPLLGRPGVNPRFTKLLAYVARTQPVAARWSVLAAVTAQAGPDAVPSSEQLALGGEGFLRAYDPSELLGDTGYAGKLELRWDLPLGDTVSASLYGFADAGRVRVKDPVGGSSTAAARSVGTGLRVAWPGGWRAFVEWAQPMGRPTNRSGGEDARVLAGLAWNR